MQTYIVIRLWSMGQGHEVMVPVSTTLIIIDENYDNEDDEGIDNTHTHARAHTRTHTHTHIYIYIYSIIKTC